MIRAIDINCDVGESFGNYSFGADSTIMPYLSSANVACGFHGGDPVHMDRTVKLAKSVGIPVGVHWGLPDLAGFGRRRLDLSLEEARCITLYQAGALAMVAAANGVTVDHWVPHGALFAMLGTEEQLSEAMLDAISESRIEPLLYWPTPLQPHCFYERALRRGFRVVSEFAADLGYAADGSLIIERHKAAKDPAAVADRLQRFLEDGEVEAVDGSVLHFPAQAILVHGDAPNAAKVVAAVRAVVDRLGISVQPASIICAKAVQQ